MAVHAFCQKSSTTVWRCRPPGASRTVVGMQGLEAVLERLHVGVLVALQLEAGGDNLRVPDDALCRVVLLEHEQEVARMAGVEAEAVDAALGAVGEGVGAEPFVCDRKC